MDSPVTAAQKNLVLRSIETPEGERCVDIFRRADGSHGFEEYRRDAEDGGGEGRGWYAIGSHGAGRYPALEEALEAARGAVPWLEAALGRMPAS